MSSGFDRIRPRLPDAPAPAPVPTSQEVEGPRALFSTDTPVPAMGSVSVHCSSCDQTSVLGMRAALRLALPSLHVPRLRKGFPSYMRCPACGRHAWVKLSLRL